MNKSTATRTLSALGYVDIRMVFGAERDERFDWTRVDVEPVPGAHGLQNAKSGPAGDAANENARFNRVEEAPVPGNGLDDAKSGPAGDSANENARFKRVEEVSAPDVHRLESAKSGPADDRANEKVRFNR